MPKLTYEEGLNMARTMKTMNDEIIEAIHKTQEDQHGVVALKFENNCTEGWVEILDEPYDENVRVFPHADQEV